MALSVRQVNVTIYRVTGKQLFFFKVNDKYCRECDLTVNVVEKAIHELGTKVSAKLEVKPWLDYLFFSILRGGYHPPVLLVEKRVVSQGAVPSLKEVKLAILEAWQGRSSSLTKARDAQQGQEIRDGA